MKLAQSGSRGVFWRSSPRGTQDRKGENGGRERGDWWIRWACPHGHLHREHVGPKALAQKEAEKHRIERPCPARVTKPMRHLLSDVIDECLKATRNIKQSWKDDHRYGEVWKARFKGRTVDEIKPAELDRIRVQRLEGVSDERTRPVTPATVNREFAFLRRVFNIALRDEKAESNPVAKLKALREPSGRVRYLTDEEERRLMKALPDDESRNRVHVLLHTGFRRGELLGLRWRDVDFKDRFRFHDLRHTFASRLAMEGVELMAIRELMGHKSMAMTLRYSHLSPEHRRAAIERLVSRRSAEPEAIAQAE